MTGKLLSFTVLALFSARDIAKMQLPNTWLAMYLGLGLAVVWRRFGVSEAAWMAGLIPGLAIMILGLATKQSIGYGDGWILMADGLITGCAAAARLLVLALSASAVWSIGLIVLKKGNRKTRLAFVPFLAIGAAIRLFY